MSFASACPAGARAGSAGACAASVFPETTSLLSVALRRLIVDGRMRTELNRPTNQWGVSVYPPSFVNPSVLMIRAYWQF
jgi:hypothetical protein